MSIQHAPSDAAGMMTQHLDQVREHNRDTLADAADSVLTCLRHSGLIFTAGAGHAMAGILETFYRAGGLACVRPIYVPELLPLNGARASTDTERRTGVAQETLAESGFTGGQDLLVVFSNSGVSPYPVELAALARNLGSTVLAITSAAAATAAPRRCSSTLIEQAHTVLDTCVPPGDAAYPDRRPVTAPLSTLCGTFLWNLLLVELYERAACAGMDLPTWHSANADGTDDANERLAAAYLERVPELG